MQGCTLAQPTYGNRKGGGRKPANEQANQQYSDNNYLATTMPCTKFQGHVTFYCFSYCQLDAFCHHFNKVLMYVCMYVCMYAVQQLNR